MAKKIDLTNVEKVGKQYLVDSLMSEKGFSRSDATEAYDGIIDAIVEALKQKVDVALSNVGTLRRETAAPRIARNPKTNEPVSIPETERVYWSTSPTLVNVLNGRITRDSLARKAPKGSL